MPPYPLAGAFRDLLFSLPASLGKRKSSLTLEEEAERAREEGLPTLSGKSVKNHMMRLSALWNQLHQRELVTRNPWTGWNFGNRQRPYHMQELETKELALLASASWHSTSVPEETFRLVTLIAAYSGMRLGEISPALWSDHILTMAGNQKPALCQSIQNLLKPVFWPLRIPLTAIISFRVWKPRNRGQGAQLLAGLSHYSRPVSAYPLKSLSIPSGTRSPPSFVTRMPIFERSGLTACLAMKQPIRAKGRLLI